MSLGHGLKRIIFRILVPLALAMTTGCATVVKGTSQGILISSDPADAQVQVDGVNRGRTPVDVQMKRKRDHLVTISKEGHRTKSIPVIKGVGGAVWGNVLVGGLIGWGVDAASGAQYNLNPPTIFVKLSPVDQVLEGLLPVSNETQSTGLVKELNTLDDLKASSKLTEVEYKILRVGLLKKYFPQADFKHKDE